MTLERALAAASMTAVLVGGGLVVGTPAHADFPPATFEDCDVALDTSIGVDHICIRLPLRIQ